MTEKQYEIVIFGATGFTGKRVVQYFNSIKSQVLQKNLAVAGRSESKLREIVKEFGTTDIGIVVADVTKPASLLSMASQAKVILNCVGPYRHFGEAVVRACVATGTDYLDISGEPEFMEAMQVRYHEAAKQAGCLITSAVGFDCIPAEVGAALAAERITEMGKQPHSVDSYLLMDWGPAGVGGHFATLESAVHGFRSIASLQKTRKDAKKAGLNPPPLINGPRPSKPSPCQWKDHVQGWAVPFPGADASVVRRTMSARGAAPQPLPAAHYLASFVIRRRWNLVLFLICAAVLQLLAKTAAGAALILRFPEALTLGVFSRAGPTEEQLAGTRFTMVHYGHALDEGSQKPGGAAVVRVAVEAPEPGYVATPIFCVEAALELLENRAAICKSIGAQGGVCTPGQLLLMHGRSYIERLQQRDVTVTVEDLQ